MPLDLNCPKCKNAFPVTEARHPVGVQCPSCDTELTAEFRKRSTPVPGESPYELIVKLGKPASAAAPPTEAKKLRLDDDDDGGKRGGSGKGLVIVCALGALLFALTGLGTAGYFMFNADGLDTSSSYTNNTNYNNRPNTGGNNNNPPKGGTPGIPNFPNGGQPDPFRPPAEPPKPRDEFNLVTIPGTIQVISPPAIDLSSPVTVALPGKAEAVAVGGNGRYIVMHIPSKQQLVVFDASKGAIVTTQSIPDNGALLLAGGRTRLITASPGTKVFRSYTLPDLQHEFDFSYPLFHPPTALAMGSAVNSPLLLSDPFGEIVLMEFTDNVAKMVEGSQSRLNPSSFPITHLRATPDGKKYFMARGVEQADQTTFLSVVGKKWKLANSDMAAAYPSGDNQNVFGCGQITDLNGKIPGNKVGGPGSAVWYVPAVAGKHIIRLSEAKTAGKPSVSLAVFSSPSSMDKDKNATQPGVLAETEGLVKWGFGNTPPNTLPLDRHLFLIPDAKLLAILPATKDKLVLRKVDPR